MAGSPRSAAQLLISALGSYPGATNSRNRTSSGSEHGFGDECYYGGFGANDVAFDMGVDGGSIPPNYFTNLLQETVGESPLDHITTPRNDVAVQAAATTSGAGPTVGGTNTTSVADGLGDDEVSSQPNAPYVGLRFDTLQEARDLYNAYVACKRFSIKQNTSRRSAYTGEVEKQQFACNQNRKPDVDHGGVEQPVAVGPIPDSPPLDEVDKEAAEIASVIGELNATGPKKKEAKKRKRETVKKTSCKAKMVVKFKDGRWEVIGFVEEHNHPLVSKPSLLKYMRSHQGIPEEEKKFVKNLHSTNLAAGKMLDIMSEFYGSEMLVPYTTKTITNLCAKFRTETEDGDMEEVIKYFEEQQEKDPDFFYSVTRDAEGRAENIFWVDGAARKAYAAAYHDCVSFDTTYLTNMYNMPFAPFIGINRHGQSIMLGCGFVRQELASSFDWLFGQFLEAMGGRQPDNIITDQDIAMKASIEKMFPLSVHRNCRWHIMQKAQGKVGTTCGRNPGLSEDFNACIDFSFSPQEFEAKWLLFMGKWPDAAAHSHFHALYAIRATWVPCYFKHRFFPFLQSTQRSEDFNAVLKRYVNPHKSLLNFVRQYEKIQVHVLVKEGANDYRTDFLELRPWSDWPIEQHALKVYTRDIYLRFRNEFALIGRYNVRPFGDNYYRLEPNNHYCAKYGSRTYVVFANQTEVTYSCECCKMQRDGILCCHILKIFTHLGIDEIPEAYILKRWTQDAVPGVAPATAQVQPDVMPPEGQEEIMHANLNMSFQKVAKLAKRSEAASAILNRHIRNAATEISQLNKSRKKKSVGPSPSAPQEKVNPRDPPKSTTKGRTKAHRTKSALELHPKQKIKCSLCGSGEHNASTCLLRLL